MNIFTKAISKVFNLLFNSKHKHLYLEEIGCSSYPDNLWGGIDPCRPFACLRGMLRYRRRARKTGVNPATCWELDTAFYQWLYENLTQLLHDTNCDLTACKFVHNDKTYTEGEYIDYLRDLCVKMINYDELKGCPELNWDISTTQDNGLKEVRWKNSPEELKLHAKIWKQNIQRHNETREEICAVFCELLSHLWW